MHWGNFWVKAGVCLVWEEAGGSVMMPQECPRSAERKGHHGREVTVCFVLLNTLPLHELVFNVEEMNAQEHIPSKIGMEAWEVCG